MLKSLKFAWLAGLLLPLALPVAAEDPAPRQVMAINNNCLVSILNRTIRATHEGFFAMPNVPSFMGRIRARVTCFSPDGSTINGQTDYFNVINNGKVHVGEFFVEQIRIPSSLRITNAAPVLLDSIGKTLTLGVEARYPDNSVQDVTAGENGTNYSVTNSRVITIDDNGTLTAVGSGSALVVARKDGAVAVATVNVITGGDSDGDGIPDEIEIANGLDPNDPVDAFEDHDGDGQVFAGQAGTTTVTVTNSGFRDVVNVTVNNFTPRVLTYLDLGVTSNNVTMTDDYAYLATATGFTIVNIDNPAAPVKISSVVASNRRQVRA